MPHLRLEYSSNVPADLAGRDLFQTFHSILARNGVTIGNCKSRAEERPAFLVGDGTREESFVHLDVRLLEGRSPETKQAIGSALLDALVARYDGLTPPPQITVELRDIQRAEYWKHPAGTI